MDRRLALRSTFFALATAVLAGSVHAQNAAPFKIGFILPMTGQSASTGQADRGGDQALAGAERQRPSPVARSR